MNWLFRLLFFVLVFLLLRYLFSHLFGPANASRLRNRSRPGSTTSGNRQVTGHTVKDPQCGTHVATTIALQARSSGQTYYFCSERCRQEFLETQRGK